MHGGIVSDRKAGRQRGRGTKSPPGGVGDALPRSERAS
jgi:hypothetical protein